MKLFLFLLIAVSAYSQGTVDWVFGVKNKDTNDIRSFVFTRTKGTAASASPTLDSPGAGKVITLTPCPPGVTSAATTHHNFRIYNAGTAETVMTTGFSQVGANCTVTVTTANAHVGTWIIGSASSGLQEALMDAANGKRSVHIVGGDYDLWGTVWVPDRSVIYGDGQNSTLVARGMFVMLEAPGGHQRFMDFFLTSGIGQGTSGLIGVRLGQGAAANFVWFTRMFFDYLWQDISSVNASQLHITDCIFYDYTDVAIVAQDTAAPDNQGLSVVNCMFFNWNLSANARTAMLINSTSSQLITNNMINDQVNWCFWISTTTSGGWLNLHGNKCEGSGSGGFYIDGIWPQIGIVGNTLSNYSSPNWVGMRLNGQSGQGMWEGVISGNIIQGGGTGNNGIYFTGLYNYFNITGNTINAVNFGMNLNSGTAVGIVVGSNTYTNIGTSPIYIGPATGIMIDGINLSYGLMTSTVSGIGNAAQGSRVYCTDCNTACSGGGGSGRTCFREGGGWTH